MNMLLHRHHLNRLLGALTGLACFVATTSLPAAAVQITSSSSTKDTGVIYTFRTAFPISQFRIGVDLMGTPNATALLGQSGYLPNADQEISWMIGGGLNGGWNVPLRDNLSVTPFLGYYYMAALTDNYNHSAVLPPFNAAGLTQLGGINYGARFDMDLPAGLFAYAGLSAWTLTNGGWDRRVDSATVSSSGTYNTGGMTLPKLWIGGGWSPIPFLTAFIGYTWFQLPTGMRGQDNNALINGGRTSIGSFEVGLQVLWFTVP